MRLEFHRQVASDMSHIMVSTKMSRSSFYAQRICRGLLPGIPLATNRNEQVVFGHGHI